MAMKRCPICGEKYSETYRDCPFCEEEDALREGEEIRRNVHGGKRAAGGRRFSLITPTLIILIIIMASLLIYLLRGGDDATDDPVDPPPVEDVTQDTETQDPDVGTEEQEPDGETQQPDDSQTGVMPEDGETTPDTPVVPDEPDVPDESDSSTSTEYATAAKLPDGLSLSTTDFTLGYLGETHTIRASGGNTSGYKWISEDDGIVSVDQNGKVTAVSGGTTNVLVTDGSKKAVCIVRVSASGTLAPSTGDSGSSGGSDSSFGLKAGSAIVVNGGNGVRVRSGPSTNHEILATVPNGADIQVIKSAGDGWYEIKFDNVGGVSTTGYMKGEFLKNN